MGGRRGLISFFSPPPPQIPSLHHTVCLDNDSQECSKSLSVVYWKPLLGKQGWGRGLRGLGQGARAERSPSFPMVFYSSSSGFQPLSFQACFLTATQPQGRHPCTLINIGQPISTCCEPDRPSFLLAQCRCSLLPHSRACC